MSLHRPRRAVVLKGIKEMGFDDRSPLRFDNEFSRLLGIGLVSINNSTIPKTTFHTVLHNGCGPLCRDPVPLVGFYDLFKAQSPEVRLWVYGQWPDIGKANPAAAKPRDWEAQAV